MRLLRSSGVLNISKMSQKSCPVWDVEVSNPSLHFFLSYFFFFPSYDRKSASVEFTFRNYPLSWLQTPKGRSSSSQIRCTFWGNLYQCLRDVLQRYCQPGMFCFLEKECFSLHFSFNFGFKHLCKMYEGTEQSCRIFSV